MSSLVKGLHHVTMCAGGAQEDVDFFTAVMGQRLVKQTVLMDGAIPIHHFYYGNADADVGSIATTFPYARRPGRAGTGQVSATSYAVPFGTIPFWIEHFDRFGIEHSGARERFGSLYVRIGHPAGLLLEVIEHEDHRRPWTTPHICDEVATRGFFGAVLSVREICEQETFLVEALGFERIGTDGVYHRFAIPDGGPATVVELVHEPDRAPGSWGFGAGTVHHLALNVETDEALVAQKAIYEELGYTDASDVKDRYYFHSMYVRSPGGILVECTANVPGGLYQDESDEDLGMALHLPPWFEDQRDAIVSTLGRISVPETNRPSGRAPRVMVPVVARTSTIPLSRSVPRFRVDEG
jgi:glyoxalase family protein